MSLRPYQIAAAEAILKAKSEGCWNQLACLSTGLGKTALATCLPDAMRMPRGKRLLFLVHMDLLAFQAAEAFRKWTNRTVGIEKAEYHAGDADIVIASVQTLGRGHRFQGADDDPEAWEYSERLKRFRPDDFQIVILDECFPSGTPIDGRPIEEVQAGEYVKSFSESTESVENRRVLRTFKRRPHGRMVRITLDGGGSIVCTEWHPVFCPISGRYRPAQYLRPGNMVLSITDTGYNHGHGRAENPQMQYVRLGVHRHVEFLPVVQLSKEREGVLLQEVLGGVYRNAVIAKDGRNQSEVCLAENEGAQPHAQPEMAGEVQDYATSYGVEAENKGREWDGTNRSAVASVVRTGMGDGGSSIPREKNSWVPDMLQIGHRQPNPANWSGDRRALPFQQEGPGRQESCGLAVTRVDRVEIFEPGSDGTFGGLCPDGFVYNLEVEGNHNYFANEVLVHNCHHAYKSVQYGSVLRYLRVLKGANPDTRKLLLGITATPNRTDNVGAEVLYDRIVFNYGIREGIKDGWLAQIEAYRVETEADLSKVHTSGGDLDPTELEKEVNTPARNALVVRKYQELTPSAPALFFTVDVAHAHALSEAFQKEGIPIYPISGKTPEAESAKLVRLLKAGHIKGLCSCQKILEGFDAPNAVAAFMTRPTKSRLLYQQMVGRVLRLYPSPEEIKEMMARGEMPDFIKRTAVVVDFADNTGRHSLVTAPTLFGLKEKFDGKGRPLLSQVEEIERLEQEHPGADLRGEPSLDSIRSNIERLDLLAVPETPEEVRAVSNLGWMRESEGSYRIALPDMTVLSVREDSLGNYQIYRHKRGIRTMLFEARNMEEAIKRAEVEIPDDALKLLDTGQKWRREPPTDAQCRHHFRVSEKVRKNFSDWQAYYNFAKKRFDSGDKAFSKGAISAKIDSERVQRVG